MSRIAIIGIGCRFPGGVRDVAGYWSLLVEGRCAIGVIPGDRWDLDGFYDRTPDLPDRSYSKWGGFLDDVRGFDPLFFGVSPREGQAMDPQQRIVLQVAVEAIEDAMMPVAALRAARAGVFIGVSNGDYDLLQRYRPDIGAIQAGTGTALSIVANRVSNRLDLSGPSLGVDTACSSSLVAVDLACAKLVEGSCDAALAGGVNVLLDPRMFVTFSRAHMLSPSGRIRAFDASADGFVRGEGAGIVVLKRLDDAVANGDRIYATIDATAVNQDGATGTITKPSLDAQIAMMQLAARRAGLDPADLDYVEAHGTGTPVGDPIEAAAIGAVFGGSGRKAPLPFGSAKPNIGHLEPAAGIAGLIKAALTLHHRLVPPSLGFEHPNPAIGFDKLNVRVADTPIRLRGEGRPLRALVNAFGFGGTNACVLLSGGGQSGTCQRSDGIGVPRAAYSRLQLRRERQGQLDIAPLAVPVSAPSMAHLRTLAAALAEALGERGALSGIGLRRIAAAISQRHDAYDHRAVVIASSVAELRERLFCLAEGRDWPLADRRTPPQLIVGRARGGRRIAFTMTGQGGQWWSMGRDLIDNEPVFRKAIEDFDRVFLPTSGWSVMAELTADETASRIDEAAITPAVMFAFQTGLANIWRERGIEPDLVLGHSFGEVTAAFLAGGISQGSVARLVIHRGLIRGAVERNGTMAAIGLGAHDVAPMLPADGTIEIGGFNAPSMVTLTGEVAAIDGLIARLEREQPAVPVRKLALDFAYHSSWFDPVESVFIDRVGALETFATDIPVISSVTGERNDSFDASYWWRNLRQPVLYQKAVETALQDGVDVFVELGPHRTLSAMTAATAAARGVEALCVTTLDRRWGDPASVAVATGQLWVAGVDVDWSALYGSDVRDFALPRRGWIDQPLWQEPEEARGVLSRGAGHPLLGRSDGRSRPSWTGAISLDTHRWLGGHRIGDACVVPASVYIEMLIAAGRQVVGWQDIELLDVVFPAALYLGADDEIVFSSAYAPERRHLVIHSRLRGGSGDWQLRARAKVLAGSWIGSAADELVTGEVETIDPTEFYSRAAAAGYGWGDQFRGLVAVTTSGDAAYGTIDLGERAAVLAGVQFDPRTLDCALQLMVAADAGVSRAAVNAAGCKAPLMPNSIDRIVVSGMLGRMADARAEIAFDRDGAQIAGIEVRASEADGGTFGVVRLAGVHAKRRPEQVAVSSETAAHFYRDVVEPLAEPLEAKAAETEGVWIWIEAGEGARESGVGGRLQQQELSIRVLRNLAGAGAAGGSACLADAVADVRVGGRVAGIVFASALADKVGTLEPASIAGVVIDRASEMIGFCQSICANADKLAGCKIFVLTTCARSTGDGNEETAGLASAGLWGAARTLALECPAVRIHLVDLDGEAIAEPGGLAALLRCGTRETEIMLRGSAGYVARITRSYAEEMPPRHMVCRAPGSNFNYQLRRLGPTGRGSLAWRQCARLRPGQGEVEVEVSAVGLNFRDVMAASGLLPDDAEPTPAVLSLGLEFSGVVRAVGTGVSDLEIGARVFGMTRAALQRSLIVRRAGLDPIPGDLSDEAAATLASAYLTAHAALEVCARLCPNETVLIHSAAGGVGLAAVAIAQRIGARIVATAGTEEKRAHLVGLGIADVFSSRSAAFSEAVMQATDCRGVDVVVNSLHGEYLERSLGCLAPYGRFVELGKRDVLEDASIGLRSLRRNASFHVVDLAAMIEERPERVREMMGTLLPMFESGALGPLPLRVYNGGEVREAFAAFSDTDHIGKVVVRPARGQVPIRSAFAHGATFDAGGSYLVTGGTRGFGRTVGEWLGRNGAGRVILASRSGRIDGEAGPLDPAAPLETMALDITDAAAVREAVRSLTDSDKPLRGIVHAAVVYDDAPVAEMAPEQVTRVLAPKVAGALNLTDALIGCGCELEFFVSFSSMAGMVGWPGQANYAAANAFLGTLARWQRGLGIRGQSIAWGVLGQSGQVARNNSMSDYLASSGWRGIDDAAALDMLAEAMDCEEAEVMIAAADWGALGAGHAPLARAPRFERVMGGAQKAGAAAPALRDIALDALVSAAGEIVLEEAAKVLRMPAAEVGQHERLADAGIDSLSSFELRNRIEQATGLSVPLDRFARVGRFSELAALVAALAEAARDGR